MSVMTRRGLTFLCKKWMAFSIVLYWGLSRYTMKFSLKHLEKALNLNNGNVQYSVNTVHFIISSTVDNLPSNVNIRLSGKFFLCNSSETSFTDHLRKRNNTWKAQFRTENLANFPKASCQEIFNPQMHQPHLLKESCISYVISSILPYMING